MSEAKHTPGPWKSKPLGFATFIYSNDQPNIAAVHGNYSTEGQANAYLIAAAPELLEALKGVFALIESGQLRRNTSDDANPDWAMRQIPFVMALNAVQGAIAKAEGR